MTRRTDKAESVILKELSLLLQRKAQDPRVQGVHIVAVSISPDFHLARVNYSTLDPNADIESVQKGLDSAKPFLRKELKSLIRLRVVPELAFFFDPSIREGDRMLGLLRSIKPSSQEKDEEPLNGKD